ncbi:hypothetical protein QUF70_21550 [Desulfobacterales bacterium HSG17]|nr:hypothetical protein [Desulfobacterales bacterium HSG17]
MAQRIETYKNRLKKEQYSLRLTIIPSVAIILVALMVMVITGEVVKILIGCSLVPLFWIFQLSRIISYKNKIKKLEK